MNSRTSRITLSLSALAMFLISFGSQGQDRYTQQSMSVISIAGTSTMHDWTMTSKEAVCDAVIETNAQGQPVKLSSLSMSLLAESLKSGKGAMDKNAYSALKTDKNKQITFQLITARFDGKNLTCTGNLTIAGTTKQIDIEATYTVLATGALQFKGSQKLAMLDYKVEPPSFMFGSVKTGNALTISFDVTLAPGKLQSSSNQ
jgi:hypothetical protein